jgi:hypothetical protein
MYLESDIYDRAKAEAKERGMSFSRYVSTVLMERLDISWPEGYFERYVGAINDDSFDVPEVLPRSPEEGIQ